MGERGAAAPDAEGAAQPSNGQPQEQGSCERALNYKAQEAEPLNPYALFSAEEPQA